MRTRRGGMWLLALLPAVVLPVAARAEVEKLGAIEVTSSPHKQALICIDQAMLSGTVTDATVCQVQPGMHTVMVMPDLEYFVVPMPQEVLVEAGETAHAHFSTVPETGSVKVTVLDDASSAPVEGAKVAGSSSLDELGETAADGTVVIGSLTAGRQMLSVWNVAFDPVTEEAVTICAVPGLRYVDVAAGAQAEVVFRVDAVGAGPSSMRVESAPSDADWYVLNRFGYTGAHGPGPWTLGDLSYGLHLLLATKEGYLTPPMQAVTLSAEGTVADVRFDFIPKYMSLTPDSSVPRGDEFRMTATISEVMRKSAGMTVYAVMQTPGGQWFSFLPAGGGMAMVNGITPAVPGAAELPAGSLDLFNARVPQNIVTGFYWFGLAAFQSDEIGGVTLDNWRSMALRFAESTVEVE